MNNQDKNFDKLRDLLRQKLEDSEPAIDGWNVPSDDVWSGLSEELSGSKMRKKSSGMTYWLSAATVVLLALLLLRECSHRKQMGDLKMELLQIEDSYEKLQKSCDEKAAFNQGEKAPEATTLPSSNQVATAFGHQQASPLIHSGQRHLNGEGSHREKVEKAESILPVKAIDNVIVPVEVMVESWEGMLPPLEPLPAAPFTFPRFETPAPKPDLHFPATRKSKKRLPLVVHFYAGAALTGNRLVGEKPDIIVRQKALMGWQAGAGLEAIFNRHWSLETGLRYGFHRLQTDYALAVLFTHNGEFQHNDGNYDNQYNHSLPSVLGNYPLQMVLTRESAVDVMEGEVMRLDLEISQRIQQLSLPLRLRYGLGKRRWQAGIRAGVVANHTLAVQAEDHPALVSHHGAIHQRHTSVGSPAIGNLQKFTFDTNLGLDFRYQLTPRTGFSFSADYQWALTPVYKSEILNSYLQSVGINAGFYVFLR